MQSVKVITFFLLGLVGFSMASPIAAPNDEHSVPRVNSADEVDLKNIGDTY
ncbi:hypothetical protein C8Q69DRAFT_526441 [Paecilomyces variotii]|uniref:Uncharacterized protein n=1 Tax=Byssochlamys spectabilis TaxID=264951 RepID=A0A443HXS8_BYSSP|nr:hypothetical protein C8Q69DRAFT_526441 [Paecilomyces variotii]RWQ96636.1 hypothetical protein C8Q69DRAFT_526441 [Paecilomyces variotii]